MRLVFVCVAQSRWPEAVRHLDSVAARVQRSEPDGWNWNYPREREPLLFLGRDPFFVDVFEEEDEVAELFDGARACRSRRCRSG